MMKNENKIAEGLDPQSIDMGAAMPDGQLQMEDEEEEEQYTEEGIIQ